MATKWLLSYAVNDLDYPVEVYIYIRSYIYVRIYTMQDHINTPYTLVNIQFPFQQPRRDEKNFSVNLESPYNWLRSLKDRPGNDRFVLGTRTANDCARVQ